MNTWHRLGLALWGLGVLSCCTGCPFRKEKIVIGKDGSVTMDLEYGGSPAEVDRFDALPNERTGWETRRTVETETDSDGETRETVHLYAQQKFEPGATLPRRFVDEKDPQAGLVLDFPTSVRFEDRPDGRYVYFRRVYPPRRWAYANYWENVFIDDEINRLSAKEVDALTQAERLQIVSALTAVQAHRQIEFAQQAMRMSFPDAPPEVFLEARQALLDAYEQNQEQLPGVLERCAPFAPEQRDACFETASNQWLQDGRNAFETVLTDEGGYDKRALKLFSNGLQDAMRYHDVTRELGGHAFNIEVIMPGEIVAHNGKRVSQAEGSGTVAFEFDGRSFRDRPNELIVVARMSEEN